MNGNTMSESKNGAAAMCVTSKFVDRKEQRSIIDSVLTINGSRQHSQVIEFYGVAGIGKSRILDEVKRKCRSMEIPFIGIDFMLAEAYDPTNAYHSFKLDILLRCCDQLDHHVDTAHTACISRARAELSVALRLNSADHSDGDLTVDKSCCYLANALQSKQIAFMLDNFDLCPDEMAKWLWDTVLALFEQTAGRSSVVVFVAGRRQQFPNNKKPAQLETERVVESHQLNPFDFDATEEQTRALPPDGRYAKQANEIHKISNGHPYSTEKIIAWLGNDPIKEVSAQRKLMAEQLLNEVVNEYILLGVDDTARRLIQLACVPRRFDAGMLQSLAIRFRPELVVGKQIQWYSSLLSQLCEAPSCAVLLGANSPAYELEPTLRRLLHTALAIRSPVEVKAIHNSVIDLIAGEIAQTSTFSTPSADRALEILYHRAEIANLGAGESNQSLPEVLGEILKAYYSQRSPKRITELNTLRDRVSQDAELAEVAGPDSMNKLRKLISDTIKPPLSRNPTETVIQLEIDYHQPNEYKVRWNRPGQTLLPTQIVVSGRRLALDDWRANPERIGKIAFKLFLPQEAQEFLKTKTEWHMQITTSAPDVPWELIHDGEQFLSLKWPVARRANFVKEPKQPPTRNDDRLRALVVGDPTDNLPGSAIEAREVSGQLQAHGIAVDLFVGSGEITAIEFVDHLIEQPYDLIHYAGHAYFDPKDPRRSGLLFCDGPFFAEELERAMESSAFVFLSACEASASQTHPTNHGYRGNMVDGLAISTLHTGCVGCLGPMWPISDVYAISFARAFYQHLLSSEDVTFSRAVQQARLALQNGPEDFWSAWTLYGDSLAKLRPLQ